MIRTLVVEDDPVAARLHAKYVTAVEGFAVVSTVDSGSAAVNVVANGAADLVLLDIGLREFSGIEVLHRLRTESRHPVDVIVVSSSRDRVTVRQALSSQVVDYLVKPFSRDALVQRLEQYRDHKAGGVPSELDSFGQGEIDSLLQRRTSTATPGARPAGRTTLRPTAGNAEQGRAQWWRELPLPKGMSEPTLDAIVQTLLAGGQLTAREIAGACGASRVTVRRYVDHLHGAGLIDVSHRYGRRGRPELIYRLVPPS